MNHYMVSIDLPKIMDNNFLSLIPYQRAQVNKLMQQGVISSYTLALDRSKLWTTLSAASESKVMDILRTFPLFSYMSIRIDELAFHESAPTTMPAISLN